MKQKWQRFKEDEFYRANILSWISCILAPISIFISTLSIYLQIIN